MKIQDTPQQSQNSRKTDGENSMISDKREIIMAPSPSVTKQWLLVDSLTPRKFLEEIDPRYT